MSDHILNLDFNKNKRLEGIFKSISTRDTILFLGAGASVNKLNRFLSADLIEYYEDKIGISFGITDIVEFVDNLSNTNGLTRKEFDDYVIECLRNYKVTDAHRILASCNWKEIITTNFDLLIENSFKEIEGSSNQNLTLKPIRSIKEYNYTEASDEVKYFKLNGCVSNTKEYDLVFSTDDFIRAGKFYKLVINQLKGFSQKINFLSIGYSFKDPLAKIIQDKFDKYNYRDKRWIYSVDPYVNDAALPLFSSKRISVIRATMDDFFHSYKEWQDQHADYVTAQRKVYFTNTENRRLIIPGILSKKLFGKIEQLNAEIKVQNISEPEYYQGEDPNYGVILKKYDIVKSEKLSTVIKDIDLDGLPLSNIYPTIFLTGSFGTGKSTFSYRLINELVVNRTDVVAFDLLDPYNLSAIDIRELFSLIEAKIIILHSNSIELNSVFKSILEFRNRLSTNKSTDQKIIFLSSIRENILEKYKLDRGDIKNCKIINIDCPLSRGEASELLERLKSNGLIKYKDMSEKNLLLEKILRDYDGDSYISLLELLTNSSHINDLIGAYNQLGDKAKQAFLYTSFLYQYKILMPAGILNSIVSNDWKEFTEEVLEKEGKGILIHVESKVANSDSDIYFKTRHSEISRRLINIIVKDEDRKFDYYKKILSHVIQTTRNSKLVIDLFKAIYQYDGLPLTKLHLLFDEAANHLGEDSHFLLYYAIDLQSRGDEKSFKKAIEKIIYAESISERRNNRLIHRRGVLYFELAKLYYDTLRGSSDEYLIYKSIEDARDFLEIKRKLDPCSAYSYVDLIRVEMWSLRNLELEELEQLVRKLKIEELLDTASRTVYENTSWIDEIKSDYIKRYKFNQDKTAYLVYLNELYDDSRFRPYALALLFNFYFGEEQIDKCTELIPEMEHLTHYRDVLKLLFKFYGLNLHHAEYRTKLFDLIRSNPELEDSDELKHKYYRYMAEAYSRNFLDAFEILRTINDEFNSLNPEFKRPWTDPENEKPRIFEGLLKRNNKGKLEVYVKELGHYFYIQNSINSFELHRTYNCTLWFYLYGINAEIV